MRSPACCWVTLCPAGWCLSSGTFEAAAQPCEELSPHSGCDLRRLLPAAQFPFLCRHGHGTPAPHAGSCCGRWAGNGQAGVLSCSRNPAHVTHTVQQAGRQPSKQPVSCAAGSLHKMPASFSNKVQTKTNLFCRTPQRLSYCRSLADCGGNTPLVF